MDICERKKRELEQLKNYYTEKYDFIKRSQRMYVHCNGKTREEAKNLVIPTMFLKWKDLPTL